MVIYTLDDNKVKYLDSLIQITTSLYNLRKRYYEIKNNSDELRLNIECQLMAIDMENKIYENHFNTVHAIRSAANYLKRNYINTNLSFLEDVLSTNSKTLAIKRIISTLYDEDIISEKEYSRRTRIGSYAEKNNYGNVSMIDFEDDAYTTSDYHSYSSFVEENEIQEWLEKTAIQLFLINIDEELKNCNKKQKSKMLMIKNNVYFLNKWLDEEFLIYNYVKLIPNLNNPPLIFNKSMSKFYAEMNKFGLDSCKPVIKKAFELAYMGGDNLTELLLMKNYIKTYSFFTREDALDDLRNIVFRHIDMEKITSNDQVYKRVKLILHAINGTPHVKL
jgi:hypothetical protein